MMKKKYECKVCKFSTDNHYDFNIHLKRKKHLKNIGAIMGDIKGNGTKIIKKGGTKKSQSGKKSQGAIDCEYCGKQICRKSNLPRHYKSCKKKNNNNKKRSVKSYTKQELYIKMLENERENAKKLLEEKDKRIEEYQKFQKQSMITYDNKKTMNDQNAPKKITIDYVRKHFTKAHTYNDLMNKPLTEKEKEELSSYGPFNACICLIDQRCIEGLDVDKRPFHCVDFARNKFAVHTDDGWMEDQNGKQVISGTFDKLNELYDKSEEIIRQIRRKKKKKKRELDDTQDIFDGMTEKEYVEEYGEDQFLLFCCTESDESNEEGDYVTIQDKILANHNTQMQLVFVQNSKNWSKILKKIRGKTLLSNILIKDNKLIMLQN